VFCEFWSSLNVQYTPQTLPLQGVLENLLCMEGHEPGNLVPASYSIYG
jgi:hypothetical protein